MAEAASPTRPPGGGRVRTPKTPKTREWSMSQPRAESSDTEGTIEVIESVPAAPQIRRTEINGHLRERIVATKVRALAAKAAGATTNHSSQEKGTHASTQIKTLTDLVNVLSKVVEEQKEIHQKQIGTLTRMHQNQVDALTKMHQNQIETLTKMMTQQIDAFKGEITVITERTGQIHDQLTNIQGPVPSPSYAEIARTPPNSRPSNACTLTPRVTTPSRMGDTLWCTIDASGVREEDKSKVQPGGIRKTIEEEMRSREGNETWQCAAVIRSARNTEHIRIVCRNEAELQMVTEAAHKTVVEGAQIWRNRDYPVKVDGARRAAVVDQEGNVLSGAAEALGKENEVTISRIRWLSRKESGKAYGTMVVYVTKQSEAARLLQDQYFHVGGESGRTRVYEPRYGPEQCFNCQEKGHKAFRCVKPQVCARCAQQGHHHRNCQEAILRCALCDGSHESFSRNCGVLHPPSS